MERGTGGAKTATPLGERADGRAGADDDGDRRQGEKLTNEPDQPKPTYEIGME